MKKNLFSWLIEAFLIWAAVSAGVYCVSLLPGSPWRSLAPQKATLEMAEKFEKEMNWSQELRHDLNFFLTKTFFFWKLKSVIDGRPAWEKIIVCLKNSLLLTILVLLMMISLELLSMLVLVRRSSERADKFFQLIELILLSLPPCLTGVMLIIIVTPLNSVLTFRLNEAGRFLLAAFALALGIFPGISALMRSKMVMELKQPYIQLAQMRAVSTPKLLIKYILPNFWGAFFTQLVLQLAGVLSGIVVIEKVFAIKGAGWLIINAVRSRDLPVIQLFFLFSFLLFHFISKIIKFLENRFQLQNETHT